MAIAVLTLTAAEMMAAPVVPAKEPATVTQPDGSTLHVRVVGDERHRIKLSDDGRRLISKQGVYYYADVDAEGRIVSTEVPAHNAATRSTEEAQFVATLSTDVMKVNSRRSRQAPKLNKGLLQASARVNGTTFPVKGKARTMVVLVDFSDNPFVTDDVYATFNEELNSPGFNQREHIGCAADYFRAQSFNKFDPQFDLYGPITVSKSVYYYGKDEDDDNIDVNISELVLEVCRALDPTVNFADYDLDGDGFVDNVYIFYAGYGENFSGAPTM
jgi:immune inhibitor A